MPSTMVHLNVAILVAKKLQIDKSDYPQLLLGSICPDAVNLGEKLASENVRYEAHLRDKDYEKWLMNVKEFHNAQIHNIEDNLLLGFEIHILTDIAWDKLVQPKMYEAIKKILKEDNPKNIKWAVLDDFDSYLLKKPNAEYLISLLGQADANQAINTINGELLTRYIDELKNEFENKKAQNSRLNILNEDCIELTAGAVEKLIIQLHQG